MAHPEDLETRAREFAKDYAALFRSPDASDPDRVGALAKRIGTFYRPGLTVFTEGKIERFESRAQAAALIEREMRNNITSGLGTKLNLEEIVKVELYSAGSALCWLRWRFEPARGSEFEGRGWGMVNVYGFRADGTGEGNGSGGGDGWEFVLRDQEIEGIRGVTGRTFE